MRKITTLLASAVFLLAVSCSMGDRIEAPVEEAATGKLNRGEVPLVETRDYYLFGGDMKFSKADTNHMRYISNIIHYYSVADDDEKAAIRNKAVFYQDKWNIDVWPNGYVEIYLGENYPDATVNRISSAIRHIEDKVPGIKFKWKKEGSEIDWGIKVTKPRDMKPDYIESSCTIGHSWVTDDDGWLFLGAHLTLHPDAPRDQIIHELCHGLGLLHEHQRPDRGNYLWLYKENIDADRETIENNFNIDPNVDTVGSYDFESIMSYSQNTYAKSGTIVLEIKDPVLREKYQTDMGNYPELSATDIRALKRLYPGEGGEIGYWKDCDHSCWTLKGVNFPILVDNWKDVAHNCWKEDYVTKKRLVGKWLKVAQWHHCWNGSKYNGWKNKCGHNSWPHKYDYYHSWWEDYKVKEWGFFWTKAGDCGGTGWPHQENHMVWKDNWIDGFVWRKAGDCGGKGWPHQYYELKVSAF